MTDLLETLYRRLLHASGGDHHHVAAITATLSDLQEGATDPMRESSQRLAFARYYGEMRLKDGDTLSNAVAHAKDLYRLSENETFLIRKELRELHPKIRVAIA